MESESKSRRCSKEALVESGAKRALLGAEWAGATGQGLWGQGRWMWEVLELAHPGHWPLADVL